MGIFRWIVGLLIMIVCFIIVHWMYTGYLFLIGKYRKCPKCGERMEIEPYQILPTNPPTVRYNYFCKKCKKFYLDAVPAYRLAELYKRHN